MFKWKIENESDTIVPMQCLMLMPEILLLSPSSRLVIYLRSYPASQFSSLFHLNDLWSSSGTRGGEDVVVVVMGNLKMLLLT
jgi:hypothetical protein